MAAGREVSSADVAARFVELDGCFNVRDLGGTPPRTDVQCAAAGSTARMRCTASPPPATPGSPGHGDLRGSPGGANVAVDSVDLVDGGGRTLWPRPGRVFSAARSHSFAQLATAIDDAFARWDRAHLHMFDLGGGEGLLIDRYWDDPPDNSRGDDTVKLSTLTGGPSQPRTHRPLHCSRR